MEDDEAEDGHAGPDHEAGGFAGLNGAFVGVFRTSGAIFASEEDGEPDVEDEGGEEAEAGNPDAGSVE